ncbi:MAG: galactokinase [Desulfobacula sp.]|nr:galactokinase [Desulfobacula sp.]
MSVNKILEQKKIEISVPCRVDLGGTLDISTFYMSMNHLTYDLQVIHPSSFNIALDLRTVVTLSGYEKDYIKVSSKGFESAVFKKNEVPFNHPMGLMFACVNYFHGSYKDHFNMGGIHIHIESSSPPRSALGGSSSGAVAIIAAFFKVLGKPLISEHIAWLAHYLEASVAGVPCGMQDQLAAAFGGVNQWIWKMGKTSPEFERAPLFDQDDDIQAFNSNIIVAYCGIPHVSKDINSQWVKSFIQGDTRNVFEKIAGLTNQFCKKIRNKDFIKAADCMNQETKLRLEMTPDVLDNTGKKLFNKAVDVNCGARFAGAGGGGCVWAIGEKHDINRLRPLWEKILEPVKDARILNAKIDNKGIQVVERE